MSDKELLEIPGMVKVGDSCPISKSVGIGDIYVSEAMLAQYGADYVRQMVRQTYSAAWRDQKRHKRGRHET